MDTAFVPHEITLQSGHQVLVRALRPDDASGLAQAYGQLSETSRYRRFFTAKPRLSEQTLAHLTAVDHRDHEALVAIVPDSGQLVGVARFIRNPREPDQAEVAVAVIDSWQRRGLGTALLHELAQRAAEESIRHFTAEILAENQPMLTLAHRLGDAESTRSGGTVSALIDLTQATGQAGASSCDSYDLLRAAARGDFIALPAVLRGPLDLPEKIIATLLVPVNACRDTSQQAAPRATAPGRPQNPGPAPAGNRLGLTSLRRAEDLGAAARRGRGPADQPGGADPASVATTLRGLPALPCRTADRLPGGMFVAGQVQAEVSFALAQARLARLTHAGRGVPAATRCRGPTAGPSGCAPHCHHDYPGVPESNR